MTRRRIAAATLATAVAASALPAAALAQDVVEAADDAAVYAWSSRDLSLEFPLEDQAGPLR